MAELVVALEVRWRGLRDFGDIWLDGDDHAAADALQEVWLDVFRGVTSLRDLGAFPAWVFRVARDRAYRTLRRRGALPATAPMNGVDLPGPASPDDELASAEDARLVRASVDCLPHAQREVLLLRYVEDMTYVQIAVATGCDVGTVRSRLHYAKGALRAKLSEKEQP